MSPEPSCGHNGDQLGKTIISISGLRLPVQPDNAVPIVRCGCFTGGAWKRLDWIQRLKTSENLPVQVTMVQNMLSFGVDEPATNVRIRRLATNVPRLISRRLLVATTIQPSHTHAAGELSQTHTSHRIYTSQCYQSDVAYVPCACPRSRSISLYPPSLRTPGSPWP